MGKIVIHIKQHTYPRDKDIEQLIAYISGHGKHHKQKEQCTPPAAACHMVKHGGHGIKQQARTGVDLHLKGKACRENNQPRNNRHKGIKKYDMQRFAHQRMFLIDIAPENCHRADTQTA